MLLAAIERLRPPAHIAPAAPRWRRYNYLRLRYVDGAALSQVCAELGVGERQARREHRAALQELAVALADTLDERRDVGGGPQLRLAGAPVLPEDESESEKVAWPTAGADLGDELSRVELYGALDVVDVGGAVADALAVARPLADGRGVTLKLQLPATSPSTLGSRSVLRQALLSLFTYLIADCSARAVDITVLPPDEKSSVNIDIAVAPAPSPSLGSAPALSAARRLIEEQEGIVRIERSQQGTWVHVALQSADVTRVLVVDDNPDVGRLFRRYARGAGLRLVQARNAFAALEMTRSLRPDVIMLDLMMPVQDGWDLLRQLQADPATAGVPVIACSILPEKELALALGARGFLAKPVSPDTLLEALEPYRRAA